MRKRILSVILVIALQYTNLFSLALQVNASTPILTETIILNEDFENGVTASTDPANEGGFSLDSTAGTDTGYNSATAFCPVGAVGKRTYRDEYRTSKYFSPPDKIASSGQYCFKFNFYLGEKVNYNYIKIGPNDTDTVSLPELRYVANCSQKIWYSIEITVDLDNDTYSFTVYNTDNTVKYTKDDGVYTYNTISNIAFSIKATNNITSANNLSGYATRIDNLYISRFSYEEPAAIEIIAGRVVDEDFENQVSTNPNYSTQGGWNLAASAGSDIGYQSSGNALCVGYAPGKTTARNVEASSEYYLPLNYTSQTGLVYFKFDFYRGSLTNNTNLYLSSSNQYNSLNNVELTNLSYNADCDVSVWYNIEVLLDLDSDSYSLKIYNTDGSLKYEKTGIYDKDTVRYISFGTTAAHSYTGATNLTGYATKIDNLEVYTHFNQSLIDLQKNGEDITANAEFYSCSWKSNSYLLFLSAYSSDGKLLGIETLEYESPVKLQDEIINTDLSMPSVANATKYKAFLWYDNMTPYCLTGEFDLSKLSEVRINEVPFDEFDKNQSNFEINICAENYPTLSATAVDENSTVSVVQPSNENGGIGTITVIPQGEQIGRTYVFNINLVDYEAVSATAQKVKNGADAVVAFFHDDGGQGSASFLSKEFAKNNLNGTIAMIGTNIVDNADIENWRNILDNSNGRLNLASHSYSHEYLGQTDDEHTVYFNGVPTTYPAGRMTRETAGERVRINGLFPNERVLTFAKPGVTKPDGITTQLSTATRAMIRENYIAMRDTGHEVGTFPPADYYQVTSLMAEVGTAELSDWRNALTNVINNKGLLVYLFHSISDSASGLTSSKADVSVLLSDMGNQVAQNKIWSAKFDEAMQYSKEYENITGIEARNYAAHNYLTVSVTDSVSCIDPTITQGKFANRDMYDYPITIKTEIPYDWDYAKLTQDYDNRTEVIKTFVENDKRYAYANVVPDCAAAVLTQATSSDYVGTISSGSAAIEGFEPAKFYYKINLPYGTNTAPEITCNQGSATITQASLSNGEGSAFVEYNNLKYEIHYSVSNTLNVLAIGNSFSQDSIRVLYNIAAADGVNINPYNAYIAGRDLKGHYNAWQGNDPTTYRVQERGISGDVYKTLKDIVKMNQWDYVILQGTTHYPAYDEGLWGVSSSNTNTYWTTLKNGIIEFLPNAKRLVHATWAPINELAGNVNSGMFAGGTPDARGAYLTALLPHEQIGANIFSSETASNNNKAYIPTAVAVDYLIRHYGFSEYEGTLNANNEYENLSTTLGVYRDKTCHLTDNVGRVLAGLVWYEMITGNSATESNYERTTMSTENMAKLKAAAHYACQNYLTYDPSAIASAN